MDELLLEFVKFYELVTDKFCEKIVLKSGDSSLMLSYLRISSWILVVSWVSYLNWSIFPMKPWLELHEQLLFFYFYISRLAFSITDESEGYVEQ